MERWTLFSYRYSNGLKKRAIVFSISGCRHYELQDILSIVF